MKHYKFVILLFTLILSGVNCFSQEITLSPLFSDGMVLQRDKAIPVFGKTEANAKVQISFRNQIAQTVSDNEGNWVVELKPEVYGGPDQLSIKTAGNQIELKNVYVGEVWICSGQSNMEMPMISNWAHVNNAEQEVEKASYPNIHLFKVERNTSFSAFRRNYLARMEPLYTRNNCRFFCRSLFLWPRFS